MRSAPSVVGIQVSYYVSWDLEPYGNEIKAGRNRYVDQDVEIISERKRELECEINNPTERSARAAVTHNYQTGG